MPKVYMVMVLGINGWTCEGTFQDRCQAESLAKELGGFVKEYYLL